MVSKNKVFDLGAVDDATRERAEAFMQGGKPAFATTADQPQPSAPAETAVPEQKVATTSRSLGRPSTRRRTESEAPLQAVMTRVPPDLVERIERVFQASTYKTRQALQLDFFLQGVERLEKQLFKK